MKVLPTNWHWTRWLRLGLAIAFLAQGLVSGEGVAWAAGVLLGLQAVLNVGCCTIGRACDVQRPQRTERKDDVTWQEIR